ncbi:hypothetical protein ACHWQZ_G014885 [Mnemiopsis leidyi]
MIQISLEKTDLQLIFVLLIGVGVAADVQGDWKAVQRGIYIPLDLENTPLEIKTDSALGSGDRVWVNFFTSQRELTGGVGIFFTSTPQYHLSRSSSSRTNFTTNLPVEVEKIWRITVDKTAGIGVKIHCNGVEVVNVLLSDTSGEGYWSKDWSYWRDRNVEQMYFSSVFDKASDYHRAVQTGIFFETVC